MCSVNCWGLKENAVLTTDVLYRSASISLMLLKTTNMVGSGSVQAEETTACIAMLSLQVLY